MIFTKQAKQNPKSKAIYAPGKNEAGKYFIYRLCSNYDGQVKGGIRKSWRVASGSEKGLTLDEAKALLEKKVGLKLYGGE